MKRLTQNAVYCTDTDAYYISTHRHDWVSFESGGQKCFIDGGNEYQRGTVNPPTVIDWCLYEDSPRELCKERALWGTYGKTGKDPLKHIPLSKCTTEHLQAILKTQLHISKFCKDLIFEILIDRDEPFEKSVSFFLSFLKERNSMRVAKKKQNRDSRGRFLSNKTI